MMLKMEKRVHLNQLMIVRMLLMLVKIFQEVNWTGDGCSHEDNEEDVDHH